MTTANKANSGEDRTTPVIILDSNKLPDGFGIPYFAGNGESESEHERRTR